MLFYFKVYAKTDCSYCVAVINKMAEHGFEHSLTLLDKAPEHHQTLKARYQHDTVPIVVKVDSAGQELLIGGCDDFHAWLRDNGYEDAGL